MESSERARKGDERSIRPHGRAPNFAYWHRVVNSIAMFPTFVARGTFRGQTRDWTLEVRDGTLEFFDATRADFDQWRFAVWHPIHARDAAKWTQSALEALWHDAVETERIGRRVEMSDELTAFLLVRGRFESPASTPRFLRWSPF